MNKHKAKHRKSQADIKETNKRQELLNHFKHKKSSMPINITSENVDFDKKQTYNSNHLLNSTHCLSHRVGKIKPMSSKIGDKR